MNTSDLSQFSYSPVLPPIVSNEKDRLFLVELNAWIQQHLSEINEQDAEQCYAVYKEAFSKVIDYVSAYRPLMTAIKSQYEDVIDVLVHGRHQAFFLRGKLSEMVNAPGTLRNYQRRTSDLETKIAIIEQDNSRLRDQCQLMQQSREERTSRGKQLEESLNQEKSQGKSSKLTKPIPGLTLEQATDIAVLKGELEKLDRQHRELVIGSRTRYVPRECRNQLKTDLVDRVAQRDQLQSDVERLRRSESLMRAAAEAAQAYLKIQLPHQTIGDVVLLALARSAAEASALPNITDTETASHGYSMAADSSDELDVDDDRDADAMLDYIEQFNELMEDKRYDEAAVHAANGPRGILRTQETMQRFIDLPSNCPQPSGTTSTPSTVASADQAKPSPQLTFCSALLSTVPAFQTTPNEQMSVECVRCALRENRIDLLTHWLSQDRLTLSESVGDLIYDHATQHQCTIGGQSGVDMRSSCDETCLMLAQKVYVDVGADVPALVCMASRGRTGMAVSHALNSACKMADLVQALRRCPTREFAEALYKSRDPHARVLAPLGVIVTTLLQTDAYDVGFDLVESVFEKSRSPGDVDNQRRPFQTAVAEDDQTTDEDWSAICRLCRERGSVDCANELLASVVAVFAIRDALQCHNAAVLQTISHEQSLKTNTVGLLETADGDTEQ